VNPTLAERDAAALDAYSSAVVEVAERLSPSVANLRLLARRRDGSEVPTGAGSAIVPVGETPYVRVKLVVKEPTLSNPTDRQMSATERSVVLRSAAARSKRLVSRYAWGDSPNSRRNSRLKWARDNPAARARSFTSSASK
jgi:hypothetical protein